MLLIVTNLVVFGAGLPSPVMLLLPPIAELLVLLTQCQPPLSELTPPSLHRGNNSAKLCHALNLGVGGGGISHGPSFCLLGLGMKERRRNMHRHTGLCVDRITASATTPTPHFCGLIPP